MKSEGFALIIVIALLVVTTSANAAPYRHLFEVTDSLPRSQWFINSSGEIVDDAHFEFYDNPSAAGFPDYPWGGLSGSAATSGKVTNVWRLPNRSIFAFAVSVTITNDTYTSFWSMNGTSAENCWWWEGWSCNRAPEIPYNIERYMYKVRLTLDFADAGFHENPLGPIYVQDYDELAWIGPSDTEPPTIPPDSPYWRNYAVPTIRFGDLAPGQSATKSIMFGLWEPLPPSSPLYNLLEDSLVNQKDIFVNRTSSLKISRYCDSLTRDDNSSWPSGCELSSNVSVFFDSAPSAGAAYVKLGANTPSDHYWWEGGPSISRDEMIQLAVTAGPDEAIRLRTMQLQADGWGNDKTDIQSVQVYVDDDEDGKLDPSEDLLASGTYDSDNGICALSFSNSPAIPAGETVHLLVVYRLASGSTSWWNTFRFNVIRIRVAGVTSGEQTLAYGLPLGSCTKTLIPTPQVVSIGEAKRLDEGTVVMLNDKVLLTTPFNRYIEEQDRSAGILVDSWWEVPTPPDVPPPPPALATSSSGRTLVTLVGTTSAGWPEAWIRVLEATATTDPYNAPLSPVFLGNKALGGSACGIQPGVVDFAAPENPRLATGLNNIGLLVATYGVVTHIKYPEWWGDTWRFWIDDGSGLFDGTLDPNTQEPVHGVCVVCPGDWPLEETLQLGTRLRVSGVLGCVNNGLEQPVRQLVPRDLNDIVVIP